MPRKKDTKTLFDFILDLNQLFRKYENVGLFEGGDIFKLLNKIIEKENVYFAKEPLFVKDFDTFDRSNKELLIGILPSMLMSEKYFPSNEDINIFSKKNLGIRIPQADKKSRPDLIGRIVAELAKMDEEEIQTFRRTLDLALEKTKWVNEDDFYEKWSNLIKNMRLKK